MVNCSRRDEGPSSSTWCDSRRTATSRPPRADGRSGLEALDACATAACGCRRWRRRAASRSTRASSPGTSSAWPDDVDPARGRAPRQGSRAAAPGRPPARPSWRSRAAVRRARASRRRASCTTSRLPPSAARRSASPPARCRPGDPRRRRRRRLTETPQPSVLLGRGHLGARGAGVADGVGERLGDDEVGGDLDADRPPLPRDPNGARGGAFARRAPRPRQASPPLHDGGRVDPAREIAELGRAPRRARRPRLRSRPRSAATALAGDDPKPQRQRDESLLGAIVQIALDPFAFRVGRLDDPRAGRLHVVELGLHRRSQTAVLERETCRRSDRTHQARIGIQAGVVDEDREQLVACLDPA